MDRASAGDYDRPMRAVLAALAVLLVLPAVAAADDQSVWDAYAHRHRAELHAATDSYSDARGARAAIAAGRRVSRTLSRITASVRDEEPSSDEGSRAQVLLLDSLASWRVAMVLDRRSLRALRAGHLSRGNAAGLRSSEALTRADRLERRAVRLLRRAGVEF
jgi:hypothetical protein